MKKLLLISIVFILISTNPLFSQSSWFNLGIGWGNQWENSGEITAKAYTSSFDVIFGSYAFRNSNFGTYSQINLMFPLSGTIEISGVKATVDFSIYDLILCVDGIYGVGYKIPFTDNMLLCLGLGPKIGFAIAKSEAVGLFGVTLGVGGQVGVKFDITDKIAISVGSNIGFNFLCYTMGSTSIGEFSGLAKNYTLFNLNPFVCVSINRK